MRPLSARFLLPLVLSVALSAGCVDRGVDDPVAGAALRVPAEVLPTGIVHELDLAVVAGTAHEVGGRVPFTITFSSAAGEPMLPGPEIRVKQGDTVRVRLLDAEHTIHWHGVRLPWSMDGVPGMTQEVGEGTVTYEFVAKDAGTFWYHCHVAAPAHVDFGMFGALIVEPADPREDPPFDREYTLFLHEMDTRSYAIADTMGSILEEGSGPSVERLTNAPASPLDAPEHARENAATTADVYGGVAAGIAGQPQLAMRGYHPKYDLFMINGQVFPDTAPVGITAGETVRIRLINAGQLTHAMHLHGHRFVVTHKDGALLSAPYLADTIGLFPGERYDIYVTGDNPGHWDFHDHGGAWGAGGFASTDGRFPGGMQTTLVYEDWEMEAPLSPVADALAAHAAPSRAHATAAAGGHGAHGAARPAATAAPPLPLALGLIA